MDTKYFLKSKRFWGLVASIAGFAATLIARYFGHDVTQFVDLAGKFLMLFGLPFTAYGAAVAEKPLGITK